MDVTLEADRYLTQFVSYHDYLDSLITPVDIKYIGSIDRARVLTEFGARNLAETLTEDEFRAKRAAVVKTLSRKPHLLCSANLQFEDTFLAELAEREKPNRTGHMFTIIFLRDVVAGNEVSAYMDYAERLEKDDWRPIFEGIRRLVPRISDLSYRNWKMGVTYFNDSRNFTNEIHPTHGLTFKNLHDSETLLVDPALPSPGNDSVMVVVTTASYLQVVLYDHLVRRR
ncbi:cilia- and flagella-associated protein 299-like [Bacillus rossius redtenbacheri]|uniref:cilia- and flagella-associated protein 299-like n=1 Tax=Bacillus rossius redtenbacheri TaxID=93214 RepID=UPI002FDEF806